MWQEETVAWSNLDLPFRHLPRQTERTTKNLRQDGLFLNRELYSQFPEYEQEC